MTRNYIQKSSLAQQSSSIAVPALLQNLNTTSLQIFNEEASCRKESDLKMEWVCRVGSRSGLVKQISCSHLQHPSAPEQTTLSSCRARGLAKAP